MSGGGQNYEYSVSNLVDIFQETGVLAFTAQDLRPPVGIFKGLYPMTKTKNSFTVEILDTGAYGYIAVGFVPRDYPLGNQPGWRAGSIAYHGDDGGIFMGSGHTEQKCAEFSKPKYHSAGKRFVTARLIIQDENKVSNVTFYLSQSPKFGQGDMVCSIPFKANLNNVFPAVGFHSPGEVVRLVDNAAWTRGSERKQSAKPLNYNYLHTYLLDVDQSSGVLQYTGKGARPPVGIIIGRYPMNNIRNRFTVEIISPGKKGCIAIGLVPEVYPEDTQPGWRTGSVAYHGDDGGIFVASTSGRIKCVPYATSEGFGKGIRFVTTELLVTKDMAEVVTFYLSSTPKYTRGDTQCTIPLKAPASNYFPAIGFHSEGERVRLVDKTAWNLESVSETSVDGPIQRSYASKQSKPPVRETEPKPKPVAAPKGPPVVFISYEHSSKVIVRSLYEKLSSMGLVCWIDFAWVKTGDRLNEKIAEGLQHCKVMIACITPNYAVSKACKDEVSLASDWKKPIIPLMIEETKPWPPMGPMAMSFTGTIYVGIYKSPEELKTWKGSRSDELFNKLEDMGLCGR